MISKTLQALTAAFALPALVLPALVLLGGAVPAIAASDWPTDPDTGALVADQTATAPQPQPEPSFPGMLIETTQTGAWLELQRSGIAASPHKQTLSGDAMAKAYKRHIDTFGQPIPPRFPKDTASTGSSGGGSK